MLGFGAFMHFDDSMHYRDVAAIDVEHHYFACSTHIQVHDTKRAQGCMHQNALHSVRACASQSILQVAAMQWTTLGCSAVHAPIRRELSSHLCALVLCPCLGTVCRRV